MKLINIAIDGPSGSGKGELAKGLAKRLKYKYLDTGALYRAVGYYMYKNRVNPNNITELTSHLVDINIELRYSGGGQIILLNGENVNDAIRLNAVSMYASAVSAIPAVRSKLLKVQKDVAMSKGVIMDGRDIGTVIMPDAELKIYLTADVKERALRRYNQLIEKGQKIDFDDIIKEIEQRDINDSTREISPAVAAPDAIIVDNTNYQPQETLAHVMNIIEERFG